MDLKDTIIKQLAAPVKRKGTQDYMTDEEGNIVTSEAAIGMTIVQKALSGGSRRWHLCSTFRCSSSATQRRRRRMPTADDSRRRRTAT